MRNAEVKRINSILTYLCPLNFSESPSMSSFSTAWSVSVTKSVLDDFVSTLLSAESKAVRTSWISKQLLKNPAHWLIKTHSSGLFDQFYGVVNEYLLILVDRLENHLRKIQMNK